MTRPSRVIPPPTSISNIRRSEQVERQTPHKLEVRADHHATRDLPFSLYDCAQIPKECTTTNWLSHIYSGAGFPAS